MGALFDGDRVHIDCFLCNEGKIRRDRAGSPAPLRSPRLDGDGDERAEPRPRAPDAAAATARISRGATAELIVGAARPAIRHREPAGGERQPRGRGSRASPCRRVHASCAHRDELDQRDAVRQAKLQFEPGPHDGGGSHSLPAGA